MNYTHIPKENQCWIFIGRTDAESGASILWPPGSKNLPVGKDPDAGKDWAEAEKDEIRWWWGWDGSSTEDEMIGWHLQLNGH